jgi:hypothetical protein
LVFSVTSVVIVVGVACGGTSKTHGESDGENGGKGGASGTSSSGTSSGAKGGASAGTGAAGASAGVSAGGASAGTGERPRGGTGAVDPIDPPGPSFCGGSPCDPPLACCMATGECFDPNGDAGACRTPDPDNDPQGRKACASSAQCGENEYCELSGLLCQGTGHCQPIGNCGGCEGDPPELCRVCACDGNTYPDPQTACRAGVNAVAATGTSCGEMGMEGGAGSSSIPARNYTVCGQDAQCPSGSFCCSMVGRCYANGDRDICIPPPPGARIACKTTENCGDNEYCFADGCTGPGGCVWMGSQGGEDCGVTIEPVCGCDGTTYTNAGCASMRGARVDHEGECASL